MPLVIKGRALPRPQNLKPQSLEKDLDSSSSLVPEVAARPKLLELYAFQKEYSLADSFPMQYRVLRIWWPKVSKDELPKQSTELLYLRIAYELQATGYEKVGLPLPKGVAQNLAAIREFDIEKLAPRMRQMVRLTAPKWASTTNQEGEQEMAGNGKKPKTGRTGVAHIYLEIFENQATAQLTDIQIAEKVGSETGSVPTTKNIASYRCAFNKGSLEGQKTAPKEPVKAVRVKKDKVKKPMSEAPKSNAAYLGIEKALKIAKKK